MPGPGDYDIKMNGYPAAVARVAGISRATAEWGRETATRAAKLGSEAMEKRAPESDDKHFDLPPPTSNITRRTPPRTRPKLKDRIEWERAEWNPGGAGGGGYHEAVFGVRAGSIRPLSHDPASIVARGSGMRGDSASSGAAIRATSGNVLTFMHMGRQVFAQSVKGQRPQRDWIEAGQHAATREVRRRIVEFDISLR